jgi:hypothetical protein
MLNIIIIIIMFQIIKIWVAYVDVVEAAGVFVSFILFRKLGHCVK